MYSRILDLTASLRAMDEDDRPRYLFVLAGRFNHCEQLMLLHKHSSMLSQLPSWSHLLQTLLTLQADQGHETGWTHCTDWILYQE